MDRLLDLEGRSAAPGAESLYADAASSDSYEEAVCKLGNLAGMTVSKATLQRHSTRIGEEMQAFEREDAEASPPAARVLLEIDDIGVPMAAREVERVAGKQADGTAKTREAKAVVCREADSLDPTTGEPRKDRNSGAAGVRIDSAQAVNGAGRASEFAARLEQFVHRNGVFAAEEVVVLSDGAPWIGTVCEEILPGRKTTFVLDLYHALEYAVAAVQDAAPDEGKRAAWMERIRKQLDAGRVDRAAAALKPHRDRSEAVADSIRTCEANRDRMRYDLCRTRRLPVGSGIVESACNCIVGNRLKGAGSQRRARHQMLLRKHALARLPRLEGLPRRSRLTKENGPHPRPIEGLTSLGRYAVIFSMRVGESDLRQPMGGSGTHEHENADRGSRVLLRRGALRLLRRRPGKSWDADARIRRSGR